MSLLARLFQRESDPAPIVVDVSSAVSVVEMPGPSQEAPRLPPPSPGGGSSLRRLKAVDDAPGRDELLGRHRRGESLARANLRGADLVDLDLAGADLAGADLEGAVLLRASLQKAKLTGARLSHARLCHADLRGADLAGAALAGADLTGALLVDADLAGADLTGADLSGANLARTRFTSAQLRSARLTRANLKGAVLAGAELEAAELSETQAAGADFSAANLRRAVLVDADLGRAILARAIFTRAQARGLRLAQADVRNADLRGADLTGAHLAQADLREADLSSAVLNGALATGAKVAGLVAIATQLDAFEAEWVDASPAGDSTNRLSGEAARAAFGGPPVDRATTPPPDRRYWGPGDVLRNAALELDDGALVQVDGRLEGCSIKLGPRTELVVGPTGLLLGTRIEGGKVTVQGRLFEGDGPLLSDIQALSVSATGSVTGTVRQGPSPARFGLEHGCRLRLSILAPTGDGSASAEDLTLITSSQGSGARDGAATVIARGSKLQGDLHAEGVLVIEGRADGALSAQRVEIAATGSVSGSIKAAEIEAFGDVSGEIVGEAVTLAARVRDGSKIRCRALSVPLPGERTRRPAVLGECQLHVGDEPRLEEPAPEPPAPEDVDLDELAVTVAGPSDKPAAAQPPSVLAEASVS